MHIIDYKDDDRYEQDQIDLLKSGKAYLRVNNAKIIGFNTLDHIKINTEIFGEQVFPAYYANVFNSKKEQLKGEEIFQCAVCHLLLKWRMNKANIVKPYIVQAMILSKIDLPEGSKKK